MDDAAKFGGELVKWAIDFSGDDHKGGWCSGREYCNSDILAQVVGDKLGPILQNFFTVLNKLWKGKCTSVTDLHKLRDLAPVIPQLEPISLTNYSTAMHNYVTLK